MACLAGEGSGVALGPSGFSTGTRAAARSRRATASDGAGRDGGGGLRADHSASIIDIPPLGIINVHASLLPKYRGAAPIQWAIANGETRTGVTTMRINAGLDTGDMLLKWETEIGPEETAVELGARLAMAGADLLVRTLEELATIRAGAAG